MAAARSRYSGWLGGNLPEFVSFPKTGRARGGAAKRKAAEAAEAAEEKSRNGPAEDASGDDSDGLWEDDDKYLVRLRRLRCGETFYSMASVSRKSMRSVARGREILWASYGN